MTSQYHENGLVVMINALLRRYSRTRYRLIMETRRRNSLKVNLALIALILTTAVILLVIFLPRAELKLREFMKVSEPLIIAITPTYKRPERFGDMTRVANTLRLVPHLHWIVVEDGIRTVPYVEKILKRSTRPFTYFAKKSPKGYPKRGWYQRSMALKYLRNNSKSLLSDYHSGVVYFADDDNSYDTRLFSDYIRHVKKLGMWAVGLSGQHIVEYPLIINGAVEFNAWHPRRTFGTDMAGFAVHLDFILNSTTDFGNRCKEGWGSPETCFLTRLGFTRKDIKIFTGPQDNGKYDVLVWHTKTQKTYLGNWTDDDIPYVHELPNK